MPCIVVVLLAGGGGVATGWAAHPDGIEQRQFHEVVVHVDGVQKAIAIDTTAYGRVAGKLVNEGPPVKDGQAVDGVLYGDDQIIQVVPLGD